MSGWNWGPTDVNKVTTPMPPLDGAVLTPAALAACIPAGAMTQHWHLHPDDVDAIARRVVELLKEQKP